VTDGRPAGAEPIAVVGMGCRVPGAEDVEAFWDLLAGGVDAVTEVPPERWDVDAYYDDNAGVPGKMNTRCGGFLKGIELFDPAFFGLSPRAAAFMDPQQRLLLEVVWEAFEHAGIAPREVAGSECGVFIGISQSDYARMVSGDTDDINAYSLTGNALSVTVNRLSYFFDLRGPSVAVDSACSSSLVAVHLACQSLRAREADMALAGGCNLILSPHATVAVSQLWLTSPGGRCKSFAEDADGYVRSEGCGVVVLKRLADARAAGDSILAVIRGSAVNQNGRGNGITAPGVDAQARVIARALQQAGLLPDEIDLIEGHGSGSRANDALELEALRQVFGQRPENQPCLLGSVKTNIGSLEPAAGVAGLIKVILALHHDAIPANLHTDALNSVIAGDSHFLVPAELHAWPSGEIPRRAGIHSYGIGGTNAHVVVEEAPPRAPALAEEPGARYPLLFSARTPDALREMAQRLRRHLALRPEISVRGSCSTLLYGRARFPHRMAALVSSREDISAALSAWLNGESLPIVFAGVASDEIPMALVPTDPEQMMEALRQWVNGAEIEGWSSLAGASERVALPAYPFQRIRCWHTD
jgi:acyl transferase domain-containing protein